MTVDENLSPTPDAPSINSVENTASPGALSDAGTADHRSAGLIWRCNADGTVDLDVGDETPMGRKSEDDASETTLLDDIGLDTWGEADIRAEADATAEPGAPVMERHAISNALDAVGFHGSYETLSAAEEQRVRLLIGYRDRAKLWKRHLIATPLILACIDALGKSQPNFAQATDLIRNAASLSMASQQPLRMPPMLLVSNHPGAGKSRYARALANALGTHLETFDGAAMPDMGSVVGYPPIWKAAGLGYAAKTLVHADTSAPMFLFDEIDKVHDDRVPHPENALLSLMERHTARSWQDEFLRVPMRAENIILVFTANSLSGLSAPFVDRVVTIRVPELSRSEQEGVLETMFVEVAGEAGVAMTVETRAALRPLRPLGLRRCRLAIELAVARAVADGRRKLRYDDLAEAAGRLRTPATAFKQPNRSRPRAPVGFIHPRPSRPVRQAGPAR